MLAADRTDGHKLGVLGRPLHVEEGGIIFARLAPGSAGGTSVMWPAQKIS